MISIDELAGRFYEGVHDNEALGSAMDTLAHLVGARAFSLQHINTVSNELSFSMHSQLSETDPMMQLLEIHDNPYLKPDILADLSWGNIHFANQMVPRRLVERTDFYDRALRPAGVLDIAGLSTVHSGSGFNLVSLPVEMRSKLSHRNEATLAQLAPHVRRALLLRSQLIVEQAKLKTLQSLMDFQARHAVILLDDNLDTVWTSEEALRLIGQCDSISMPNGRFHVEAASVQRHLQSLQQQARVSHGLDAGLNSVGDAYVASSEGGIECAIRVYAASWSIMGTPVNHVVLALADANQRHRTTIRQLQDYFSLSPAEAITVVEVGYGKSLDVIAQERQQKIGTTRNLLKRGMSKMGVHRQAELVSFLWSIG